MGPCRFPVLSFVLFLSSGLKTLKAKPHPSPSGCCSVPMGGQPEQMGGGGWRGSPPPPTGRHRPSADSHFHQLGWNQLPQVPCSHPDPKGEAAKSQVTRDCGQKPPKCGLLYALPGFIRKTAIASVYR